MCEILGDALTLSETPIPLKIARLFLASDILHNTSSGVRNATRYRRCVLLHVAQHGKGKAAANPDKAVPIVTGGSERKCLLLGRRLPPAVPACGSECPFHPSLPCPPPPPLSRLEELLPDVFESLQEAYRTAEGRMAQVCSARQRCTGATAARLGLASCLLAFVRRDGRRHQLSHGSHNPQRATPPMPSTYRRSCCAATCSSCCASGAAGSSLATTTSTACRQAGCDARVLGHCSMCRTAGHSAAVHAGMAWHWLLCTLCNTRRSCSQPPPCSPPSPLPQATFLRSGGDASAPANSQLESDLEGLGDEELELRCRRAGVSRKGGRSAQISRLLALDAYLHGDSSKGGEGGSEAPVKVAAKPTSAWAEVGADAAEAAGPKSKWERQEDEQPAAAGAAAAVPAAPAAQQPPAVTPRSKWDAADRAAQQQQQLATGHEPQAGSRWAAAAAAAESDSDEDLAATVVAAKRQAAAATATTPTAAAAAQRGAAAGAPPVAQADAPSPLLGGSLDPALEEERRQRLRQVEVVLVQFRERLEDKGLSKELVERKVAEQRAKLLADAEAALAAKAAAAAAAAAPSRAGSAGGGGSSSRGGERDKREKEKERERSSREPSSRSERRRSRSRERDRDGDRRRSRSRSKGRSRRRHSRSRSHSRSPRRSRRSSRSRSRSRERRR